MSRKEKPSFDVEMPPPIGVPPLAAPSADRFAVLMGGQSPVAQPAAQAVAPRGLAAPVVSAEELAQERRGARTHTRKRDGATLRRLHVRLPLELERQLKRYCVDSERAAGDVVVDALRSYLLSSGK